MNPSGHNPTTLVRLRAKHLCAAGLGFATPITSEKKGDVLLFLSIPASDTAAKALFPILLYLAI
jgi:hypothetical protein